MRILHAEGFITSGFQQPVAVYLEGYQRVAAVWGMFVRDGVEYDKLIFFADQDGKALVIIGDETYSVIDGLEPSPLSAEDWAHELQDTNMETSVLTTTIESARKALVGKPFEEY